jgi:hypothetical protein
LYDRLICRPVNQGTCIVKIEQLLCERNFWPVSVHTITLTV